MKQILKLIGGFLGGTVIGIVGVMAGIYLFTDISQEEFIDKLAKIELYEIVGVPLISIIVFGIVFFLQVIIHEGGHLIAGLTTGYRFVSFRIFNFTLIRKEGTFQFKSFGLAGTGGQCLLTPPDKPIEEIPFVLYNMGGVLANILTALLALIPLLLIDNLTFIPLLSLLFFALSGFLLALLNGIPLRAGGMTNDAENMRLMRKNPTNKRLLVTILRANALVQEALRPKEMPKEMFPPLEVIDYADSLQCNYLSMYVALLIDRGMYEEAYALQEKALQHKDKMVGLFVNEFEAEQLYLALITGRKEMTEQLCKESVLTYIKQYAKVMSSKQRILSALAFYRDGDTAKAKEIYELVNKNSDQYLMQGEVKMDLALMETYLI